MPIEETLHVELFHAHDPKDISRLGSQIADYAAEGWIDQDTYRRLGRFTRARLEEIRSAHRGHQSEEKTTG